MNDATIPNLRTARPDETDDNWLGYILGFYRNELAGMPQQTITEISCLTAKYLRGDLIAGSQLCLLYPAHNRCRAAFTKGTGVLLPSTPRSILLMLNRT